MTSGLAALPRGELARKLVHMAVGLVAFAVVFLGPLWSAVAAAAAVVMNLFLLPRLGGKALWRAHESERGMSLGIVLYPLAVLLLIVVFWRRIEVAAAVWGILAFGDGMASIVGMAWGKRPLPWNARKTWLGTFAYFLFGTIGATILLWWTVTHPLGEGGRPIALGFALTVCAVTALAAAWIESLPQELDDNISVPLIAGLILFSLLATEGRWLAGAGLVGTGLGADGVDLRAIGVQAMIGSAVNAIFALLAWRTRGVDRSGAWAGFAIGTTIFAMLGWRGYLLLLAFFVLGTAATKLGYRRKAQAGIAQERGGRRSARHAIANTGVAAAAAVFAAITPFRELYLFAFAGAFATALADTLGSEVGQLYGRRTFLVTTLRPVPRGTDGAVSLEGTTAGALGALLIGALGTLGGLFPAWGMGVVAAAAVAGSLFESVIGATIEKRALLDNEAVNFLNTLIGALLAVAIAALVGPDTGTGVAIMTAGSAP